MIIKEEIYYVIFHNNYMHVLGTLGHKIWIHMYTNVYKNVYNYTLNESLIKMKDNRERWSINKNKYKTV